MKQTPKIPANQPLTASPATQPSFNIGRFIAKSLGWIIAGAVIGSITAGSTGNLPESYLGFVIGGAILASFIITGLSVSRTIKDAQGVIDGAADSVNGSPVPARVESLDEGGITLKETYHEFIFMLTVFPSTGEPYRTTIRQYITMGDLPNFPTGAYVPFIEDVQHPGYGAFNRKLSLPDTSRYDGVVACKTYPDRGRQSSFGGIAKTTSTPGAPLSPIKMIISLILIIIYLVGGFLTPFIAAGSLDTFSQQLQGKSPATIADREQDVIPEDEKILSIDSIMTLYDKAADTIGERRIKSLFIHVGFVTFTVENPDRKGAYDDVTIQADGEIKSRPNSSSSSIKKEDTFTLKEAPVDELIRAYTVTKDQNPEDELTYAAFMKAFEAIPDPNAPGGVKAQQILESLIYVNDPYHSYPARYDVRTGEILNKGESEK